MLTVLIVLLLTDFLHQLCSKIFAWGIQGIIETNVKCSLLSSQAALFNLCDPLGFTGCSEGEMKRCVSSLKEAL